MKKGFYYSLITLLSIALLSFSCSNDDGDSSMDNSLQIAQVQGIAENGTWRITNFNDSGQDYTQNFSGYTFTFNTDGTLVAINDTIALDGTWSVTSDSSSDDDGSDDDDDDIEFNIFFPVPVTNNFEDLNDDWDIVSTSATRIELIDYSDNSITTDRLIFEKN